MWQSGTLSLWLTGKSVGSVKNLSGDSELKWLCRETMMTEDRAARLRPLSSTFASLSVETCWKNAASPSRLFPPNKKSVCKLNCSTRCLWKWRASRWVCCQWTCTQSRLLKSRKSSLFSAAASVLLFSELQSLSFFMVRIHQNLHLLDDDMNISDVRLSLPLMNQQHPGNIHCTFTATTENSFMSKCNRTYFHAVPLSDRWH